jgi:hypothetical protein
MTAADWTARPRERTVNLSEKIGKWTRAHETTVSLGKVSPGTIRKWEKLYNKERRLSALALSKKGRSGRAKLPISDALLWYVLGNSVDTARADIVKAVAFSENTWPAGDFPRVSIRTWQRRIAGADPAKVMAVLGKSGKAAFANDASPDIERDWSALPYNGLWQIDDVQMDWYCHRQSNPEEICRPWLYAIMRVPTREWVAYVVSEEPITQRQVAGLLGYAMSNPAGGLPDAIGFERGTVALSDSLAETLTCLGVRWSRASVDGGRTWSGAIPDDGKGHSRAKAVLESNNRRLHATLWRMAAQIGTEERHTAPGNTEAIKRESIRRVKAGLKTLLPHWVDARACIDAAMQECNHRAHSGLPRMWDADARRWRHYAPAEWARELAAQAQLRLMDSYMIPTFYADGRLVEVTKNGVQIGVDRATGRRRWYGRADADLDLRRGTKVTCYVIDDYPGHCYVAELGRTVARYELEAPSGNDQIADKKRTDRGYLQRFERLMVERGRREQEYVERAVAMAAEPNVPEGRVISVSDEQLRQRTASVVEAGMRQAARESAIEAAAAMPTGDAATASPAAPAAGGSRRRSILDLKGAGEQFAEPKADASADRDGGEVIEMEAIA